MLGCVVEAAVVVVVVVGLEPVFRMFLLTYHSCQVSAQVLGTVTAL